ncbi:related to oxidoreductase [Phialocephala subalpina]|uniref:Related to oxidoreductase n=1 Tax=Phialocephala subalpina TaxID=576137 RepID=A0A1L7XSX8_9HELO|nr:related to oxidoreductase [Phialocephala subalpina]
MAQITNNKAAWIPFEKAKYLEVGPGPTPDPGENEVVIKVAYAAVNPSDWKFQDHPYWVIPYPSILGTDVAGTVAQLGSAVTRFKVGQRVIGHCDSILTHKAANAGYQLCSTTREILITEIPDSLPLAHAAVLPLSIDTAVTGLFTMLKLPYPSLNPTPTGKTVLIWGGSSSVGSSAIQLADLPSVAAGLTVATTAGPHNEAYVKSLGATHYFDYKAPNVVEKIRKVLKKGDVIFDVTSTESSQKACAELLSGIGGGLLPIVLFPVKTGFDNVEIKFTNGLDPGFVDFQLGDYIWKKFIPQALATGKFQAKPDPLILEGGLERVQEGINMLRKGVSAQKIVIEVAKHA